jgi:hypothetical protein
VRVRVGPLALTFSFKPPELDLMVEVNEKRI